MALKPRVVKQRQARTRATRKATAAAVPVPQVNTDEVIDQISVLSSDSAGNPTSFRVYRKGEEVGKVYVAYDDAMLNVKSLVQQFDKTKARVMPVISLDKNRSAHDKKTYQFVANGSATDGAAVIAGVTGKVIKIHRLFLQSTVDGATDVYLYEETSGSQVTGKTTLNAREGRESAFLHAPAFIGKTTTQGKGVLLKNAAAKQVNWEITYSADDAS